MFRLVTSRLYGGRDEPAQIVIVFSVLSYSCLLAKLALVDSDGGRDEVPRCKQVLQPFAGGTKLFIANAKGTSM